MTRGDPLSVTLARIGLLAVSGVWLALGYVVASVMGAGQDEAGNWMWGIDYVTPEEAAGHNAVAHGILGVVLVVAGFHAIVVLLSFRRSWTRWSLGAAGLCYGIGALFLVPVAISEPSRAVTAYLCMAIGVATVSCFASSRATPPAHEVTR